MGGCKSKIGKYGVRAAALFLIAMFSIGLAGCTGARGKVPSKNAVRKEVNRICKEKYHLVSWEKVREHPDDVEYTFETDERKLRFTAHSYLARISIDATYTPFYSKEISCDYVRQVHNLYEEDVLAELSRYGGFDKDTGDVYLDTFDDVRDFAQVMARAQKIYGAEKKYNSKDFMQTNPVLSLSLFSRPSDVEAGKAHYGEYQLMGKLDVDGIDSEAAIYDAAAKLYVQSFVDHGEIPEGVPKRYLENIHPVRLDRIYLNGEQMLYDAKENPYSSLQAATQDVCYSWYSKQEKSYMLVSDIGYQAGGRSSVPMVIREYVTKLGGTYDLDEKNCKATWTIGKDTWTMKGTYRTFLTENVTKVKVEKNGEPLDIRWVSAKDDPEVLYTFCIGIPVKDFVKLFGLGYNIDESGLKLELFQE